MNRDNSYMLNFRLSKCLYLYEVFRKNSEFNSKLMFLQLKEYLESIIPNEYNFTPNDINLSKSIFYFINDNDDSDMIYGHISTEMSLYGEGRIIRFPYHYRVLNRKSVYKYGYPKYKKDSIKFDLLFKNKTIDISIGSNICKYSGFCDKDENPLYEGDLVEDLSGMGIIPFSNDNENVAILTSENGYVGLTMSYDLTFIPLIDLSIRNKYSNTKKLIHYNCLTTLSKVTNGKV